MRLYYFASAVFVIFTLLTPSDKIFTFSYTNTKIITYGLISDVCCLTRNPSLCQKYLNSLRGARLYPNSLVVLSTSAQSRGNKTATMIRDHYLGLPAAELDLKRRFKRCVHYYSDVMKQLNKSKKCLSKGKIGFVIKYSREIIDQALSCDVALVEPPWAPLEPVQKFLQANGDLIDLCGIMVAICNELSS